MLRRGDELLNFGNGYTLVIPPYSNPTLLKLYDRAKSYAEGSEGRNRVGELVRFVHGAFSQTEGWQEGAKTVPLQRALYKNQGVCKEIAATLAMVLSMEGVPYDYVRGTSSGKRHAWLRVHLDNEQWLADPTQNLFGRYDSVSRHHGFEEGHNFVRRNGQTINLEGGS